MKLQALAVTCGEFSASELGSAQEGIEIALLRDGRKCRKGRLNIVVAGAVACIVAEIVREAGADQGFAEGIRLFPVWHVTNSVLYKIYFVSIDLIV